MTIKIGVKAPDFDLPGAGEQKGKLSDLKGSKVVLYFYPKDMTPGCTKEAEDFRDSYSHFSKQNTVVIGVSRDSIKRHENFTKKLGLPFNLVSDEDGKICEEYGVWVEKKNYGKTYMGIERSTFLINEDGKVDKIWRKVKVKNHVDEVLEALNF